MGSTPVFGIRYPDASTKANQLAAALQTQALDTEAALVAAEIPPAQPMSIVVASTDAGRDAHWGVPASEAERLTLQNGGATTVRPDLGWTEQYYATYNAASNPAGATPAGWYPVGGRLPSFRTIRAASQLVSGTGASSIVNGLWGEPDLIDTAAFTYVGGALTCKRPGLYSIAAGVQVAAVAGIAFTAGVTKNFAGYNAASFVAATSGVTTSAVQSFTAAFAQNVPLAENDVLRFVVAPGSPLTIGDAFAGAGGGQFAVTYTGPKR